MITWKQNKKRIPAVGGPELLLFLFEYGAKINALFRISKPFPVLYNILYFPEKSARAIGRLFPEKRNRYETGGQKKLFTSASKVFRSVIRLASCPLRSIINKAGNSRTLYMPPISE